MKHIKHNYETYKICVLEIISFETGLFWFETLGKQSDYEVNNIRKLCRCRGTYTGIFDLELWKI